MTFIISRGVIRKMCRESNKTFDEIVEEIVKTNSKDKNGVSRAVTTRRSPAIKGVLKNHVLLKNDGIKSISADNGDTLEFHRDDFGGVVVIEYYNFNDKLIAVVWVD